MNEQTTVEPKRGTKGEWRAFIYPVYYLIGIVVGAMWDIMASGRDPVESFLFYTIVIGIGLNMFVSFFMHYFLSAKIAKGIGWEPSPFQKELAWSILGLGLVGLMCIWIDGIFWLAPIVMVTPFFWGAAAGHIKEAVKEKNYTPGNVGPVLWMDIILPIVCIVLAIIYWG